MGISDGPAENYNYNEYLLANLVIVVVHTVSTVAYDATITSFIGVTSKAFLRI